MAYTDLYKRSIFFEILSLNQNREPLTVVESLAFTMPPSNIEILQTQRVTKTATPGGFFIDNYGLGSANITISGETGNDEKRLSILGAGKTPRSLTGQDAWFEFRDRIARYSDKSQDYVMRFYDLTHKGTGNIFRPGGFTGLSRYSEAWEVVLDDSASRRNSQKPFFYPYTINLTGIRPLGTFNARLAKNAIGFLSDIRENIDTLTDAIQQFRDNINFFLDNAFEYIDDVTSVFTSISSFVEQIASFSDLIIEYEQKLGGVFDQVVSETQDFLNSGLKIVSFPYDVLETARVEFLDVVSKTSTLIANAKAGGKAVIDRYDWNETIDPVSSISLSLVDMETPFNKIVLLAKQDSSYEPVAAIVVNGVVTPIYGYIPFAVKENTTLERIARDYLGDIQLKEIISGVNGVYSNDELVVGEELKIPVLSPNVRYANNAVYNVPEDGLNILGNDAYVNNGVFELLPGDYALVSGDMNVLQAVQFRLLEQKGRQLKDGSYGIVAQIGSALNSDSPIEYLSISIAETLVQDPRITSVYGLNFIGDGDKIYQEFKYDTITKVGMVYREGL